MEEIHNAALTKIVDKLVSLSEKLNSPVAKHYIETRDAGGGLIEINANSEGMIFLARYALKLALSDVHGKQWQLDEHSLLDHCEKKVVLTRIDAPI